MPVVLMLGFAVVAGAVMYLQHKEEQHRDAVGWSFDEIVSDAIGPFDANGDGALNWDARSGAKLVGEAIRVGVSTWTEAATEPGLPKGTKAVRRRTTTWGHRDLLTAADSNKDGIASHVEVTALVKAADTNRDGRISREERRRFFETYGADRLDERTVTVEYIMPPAPAAPGANSSASGASMRP